jgi:hypothetical protein
MVTPIAGLCDAAERSRTSTALGGHKALNQSALGVLSCVRAYAGGLSGSELLSLVLSLVPGLVPAANARSISSDSPALGA